MINVIVSVTPGNFTQSLQTTCRTLKDFLESPVMKGIISDRAGNAAIICHLNGDKQALTSTVALQDWAEIAISKDVKGA